MRDDYFSATILCMKKNLLLYKSKWGATKTYAEWIKEEEPSLELVDLESFDCSLLDNFYKVVIGSRTYMGKIEAIDFLSENWSHLKQNPVYLYSVGMISPESQESVVSYEMIPEDIRENLAGYTKLMGKIDYQKLNSVQKLIVKARKMEELDELDRTTIEPIVSFLKGIEWKFEDTHHYIS